MIAGEFEFFAPRTIADTLKLISEYGGSCKVLAGGMTLLPVMTLGLVQPAAIVSLNHVAGLDAIEDGGRFLRLGAMVRHATVAKDPLVRRFLPLLAAAAGEIGDVQVRHRGTLGGSLVHADPAADYLCATATLEARYCVRSARGERWLNVDEFFRDVMTSALEPDELLTSIEIPKQPEGVGFSHLSLRRVEGAFPIVLASVSVAPNLAKARIGLGGVGPRPVVLDFASELKEGFSDSVISAIGDRAYKASEHALADLNGSAEYRREMARVYARRAVRSAMTHFLAGASA